MELLLLFAGGLCLFFIWDNRRLHRENKQLKEDLAYARQMLKIMYGHQQQSEAHLLGVLG